MSDLQPTDALWDATLAAYREAGWEGEDPGDFERMFWEAGFKQGATASERELHARELHHFEAEKAMTEALAVLDSHEQGEDDRLESIFRAQSILRAALTDHADGSQT